MKTDALRAIKQLLMILMDQQRDIFTAYTIVDLAIAEGALRELDLSIADLGREFLANIAEKIRTDRSRPPQGSEPTLPFTSSIGTEQLFNFGAGESIKAIYARASQVDKHWQYVEDNARRVSEQRDKLHRDLFDRGILEWLFAHPDKTLGEACVALDTADDNSDETGS